MAHFKRKFVIRQGKLKDEALRDRPPRAEFYHRRSNVSALSSRLIQINPDAALNSSFTYMLKLLFDNEDLEYFTFG
jgi:hypothetical protein